MALGSILVLVFVVWIHMGFFHPNPLDDLTIKFNLNESPKGDEKDEAHDYESSTEHVITINNHLDQYMKGVIQLKYDKSIEFNIEPEDVYQSPMIADDSLINVEASIIGNIPSVQGSRYSDEVFTKRIKVNIFDSSENLAQLLKIADQDLVRPEHHRPELQKDIVNKLRDLFIDNIGKWIEIDKIDKLMVKMDKLMVKSYSELYLLKKILILLAEETVDRSNQITKLFKIIKQDDAQTNTGLLKYNAKEMKKLVKRSSGILEDAIVKFRKHDEDVVSVKLDLKNIINEIGIVNDKQKIVWKRKMAEVLSTVVFGKRDSWKKRLNKEKAKFDEMEYYRKNIQDTAKKLLNAFIDESKSDHEQLSLIQEWTNIISNIEDDFDPEAITEVSVENLCKLTKRCMDYIDHHHDLSDIASPPRDVDCSAAGTPGLKEDGLPAVKCKPYHTNGKTLNFYKIVLGQDPEYDCVVERGR